MGCCRWWDVPCDEAMLLAVAEVGYVGSLFQREPWLGLVEIPRGIMRSAGSLWTRKLSAVSQEMWRSRVRAVNLMAWVGVRTTMERLCAGVGRWELDGRLGVEYRLERPGHSLRHLSLVKF